MMSDSMESTAESAPDGVPLLVAREVRRSYGPTPALRGIDVTVDRGEFVAVTGPSGCGKSTLLHCLAGILLPDTGSVTYAGRQLSALSEADRSALRRTEIGVVFQYGQLVAELTAAENVMLPLLLGGSRRRAADAVATEALERFGVGDLAARQPAELSGGQQQRVALARAIVTGPRLLFADEPTGSLDSLATERLLTELVRQARENGTTVVLVTHDARVAAYATREISLLDGRVDESGVGLDNVYHLSETSPAAVASESTRGEAR